MHWFSLYTMTPVGMPAAGHTPLLYVVCEKISEPEGVENVAPETHLLDTELRVLIA